VSGSAQAPIVDAGGVTASRRGRHPGRGAQQVARIVAAANVTLVVAGKEPVDAAASQHRYAAWSAGRCPLWWREPTASAGKQVMASRTLPEFITTVLTTIACRLDGPA
jgi:hypothetical protein